MAKFIDPLPPGFNPGPLNMEVPLDNQVAMLKLSADLSGEPVIGIFPGKAWIWIPDEGNFQVFNTYGVGCSRLEYNEKEEGWRFYLGLVNYSGYCIGQRSRPFWNAKKDN